MNRTNNYNLCQWEADDKIQRVDFNEDNAKIDAALGALAEGAAAIPKLAVGSYPGDGAATRFISTGFTPKAVLVFTDKGYTYSTGSGGSAPYGGLAVTGSPAGPAACPAVKIVSGGFNVAYQTEAGLICSNKKNDSYNYIALG